MNNKNSSDLVYSIGSGGNNNNNINNNYIRNTSNTNNAGLAGESDSLASESYQIICARLGIKPNAIILDQLSGTDMAVATTTTIDASHTFLGSHGVDALCELLILHQGIRHVSLPANGLIQSNIISLTQAARSHSALESIDISNNKSLSTPAAREIWECARASGSLLVDAKVEGTAIPAEWKTRIQRQLEINRENVAFGFDAEPQPRPRDQWLEVRIFLLAEVAAHAAVEKFMEKTLSLLNAAGAAWRVRFSCLVHFDDTIAAQSAETIRSHVNNCGCSMNYDLPWIIIFIAEDHFSPTLHSFISEFIEPLTFPDLPPLYTKFGVRRDPLRKPYPSVFMMRIPDSLVGLEQNGNNNNININTSSMMSGSNNNNNNNNMAHFSSDNSGMYSASGSFHYALGSNDAFGSNNNKHHHFADNNNSNSSVTPPATKAVRFFNAARYPECAAFLRLQTDMLVSLGGVFYTPRDLRVIDVWTDAPDAFREGLGRLAAQFQREATPLEIMASMEAQPKEVEQIYNYATRTMTTQNAVPLLVYGSRGVGRRSVTQAAVFHAREDLNNSIGEGSVTTMMMTSLSNTNNNNNNNHQKNNSNNNNTTASLEGSFGASPFASSVDPQQQQQQQQQQITISSAFNNNNPSSGISSPLSPNSANNNNNINTTTTTNNNNEVRIVRWDMSINNSIVQFLMFLLDVFVPENRALPTSAHNGNIELMMLTAQQAIRHYKGRRKIILVVFDVDLIDTAWATGLNPYGWFPLSFPSCVRIICTCATESSFLSEMRAKEQQPYDLLIRGGKRSSLCRALRIQWEAVTAAATTSTTAAASERSKLIKRNSASPFLPPPPPSNNNGSSSSSETNRRNFVGLGKETEDDEYHTRPSAPASAPQSVAAAILSKQDSDLFLYVSLFASWIALECDDLGTDEKDVAAFIHQIAPQTTHDLVQRMIQKLPFVIDRTDSLAERKSRVFNTIACLCSASALTSNEIAKVCEQVYSNRRYSIIPLLTVLEHFGLIVKRFDGCLAPAHPVIRTAFEAFVQRDPSLPLVNKQLNGHSANVGDDAEDRHGSFSNFGQNQQDDNDEHQYNYSNNNNGEENIIRKPKEDIWGAFPINPTNFRLPLKYPPTSDENNSNNTNRQFTTMMTMMNNNNNNNNLPTNRRSFNKNSLLGVETTTTASSSSNPRVPATMELDACRSAFAVIHYHSVCNLTVGFIRSFSILPDLLIHSAQPQKLVQLLSDVVLLDSIVRHHATGSVYVVDAMMRTIHHLSALSHMFTIEGYTRHQFSHNADLGRLTRALRDFLKIRSGSLWQAALALQHDSTLFQNATKQFDRAPYPSLCLRNRTDAETQSLETHIPKFELHYNNKNNKSMMMNRHGNSINNNSSSIHHQSDDRSKSLRHCCLSDPFLAVTCESGLVTIYEMTKIGGLRVASKQAAALQQQQQQLRAENGILIPAPPTLPRSHHHHHHQNHAGSAEHKKNEKKKVEDEDPFNQCFKELCAFDFSSIGFEADSILGCVISSGLSPTALVVFANHCAVWRFSSESPKSPSYISKIENCTASLRHEVFAPGGSTFTGVAFIDAAATTTVPSSSSSPKKNVHSIPDDNRGVITTADFSSRDVERKVVVIDVASAKILSVVNAPNSIFVREAHYAGAAGILVVEPQGVSMCRNDGNVLQMRSPHLSQAHSIRACAHSRDGSLVGVVTGVRAVMWHVGRSHASHEEMPLHTITASSPLLDLTFIPSGAQAAIAAEDGNILLWNTITGLLQQTLRLDTPDPPAYCIFTPNGRLIARAGTALRMWDVVTNQDMGGVVAHEGVINYIESSGSLLASCCDNGTIKLWDVTPSLPPLTKLKDSGDPTNDLYRFGFVGPKKVHRVAVSDDSTYVVIQIGTVDDALDNANFSSQLETTLWGVDLDRSPIGEYESAAPFIRRLPDGITSAPLFLRHMISSAERQQMYEEEEDDENEEEEETRITGRNKNTTTSSSSAAAVPQRGRSPIDDPTVLLYVDSKKQLVKHCCETGESFVIGVLPREILDGYVEMYHRSDYVVNRNNNNNNNSNTTNVSSGSSSTSIAITTTKTLGGCRIVLFDVPLGFTHSSSSSSSSNHKKQQKNSPFSSGRQQDDTSDLDVDVDNASSAILIAQLVGHGAPIIGVDYLPTAVVSASQDRQLILWSTASYAQKSSKVFDAPLVAFARIFEGEFRASTPGLYCVADAAGAVMIVDCKQPTVSSSSNNTSANAIVNLASSSSSSSVRKINTSSSNNQQPSQSNNNNTINNNIPWKITVIKKVMLPHCVLLAQPLLNPNTLLISLEGSEGELFVWDVEEMKPINRIEITRSSTVTFMAMVSPQVVENNPIEVDENGLLVFAGTASGVVKMYSVEG